MDSALARLKNTLTCSETGLAREPERCWWCCRCPQQTLWPRGWEFLAARGQKPDGEDHAQTAQFGSRVIGRVAREWVTHLRIGNGNGAWVLLVAKPGVLYVVHLGVVRLNVGEVLPTGRPPEALTRREHLLWKRERAMTLGRIREAFDCRAIDQRDPSSSPSYTQSGIPLKISLSRPFTVTCCGGDVGLVLIYTLFFQT